MYKYRSSSLFLNVNGDQHKTIYKVGTKTDHFQKCIIVVYNDMGRRSIYQYIQLFIRSKNGILNIAIFKYFLHKMRNDTTLIIPKA